MRPDPSASDGKCPRPSINDVCALEDAVLDLDDPRILAAANGGVTFLQSHGSRPLVTPILRLRSQGKHNGKQEHQNCPHTFSNNVKAPLRARLDGWAEWRKNKNSRFVDGTGGLKTAGTKDWFGVFFPALRARACG